MINDNWPGRSYKKAKADDFIPPPVLLEDNHRIMPPPIEEDTNPDLTDPINSWAYADEHLLEVADQVVNRRDEQYGQCHDHHSGTAALWSVFLGFTVTPAQVSTLFILDKIIRSRKEDKPDHWVDIAGYAAVHAKVQAEEERNNG